MGIDHGTNVKNEKYAYTVFSNMDKADLAKTEKKPPYQILSNTEDIQSVQFNAYTSIVFHQPGTIKINNKIKLSSNVPAILLCKVNHTQLDISICDPTQKLKTGQITITGTGKSGITTLVKEITFPVGIKKGTPVNIEININQDELIPLI